MKFLAFVVLIVFATTLASAQELTGPDAHAARVATDVSHVILSPFCPGKTLAMCPSPAAAEVRMEIQEMAESGMEPEAIKNAVIAQHGEEFRIIQPPWTDDVGLLGLLGIGLVLAVFAVVIITRRRASATVEPEPAAPATEGDPEDPYLAQLRKHVDD